MRDDFNAGVQPQWIQGDLKVGTELVSLEKYIFNHRYIERLEMDSVVGRLVEKRGWKTWITWNSIHAPHGNSARKMRSKKEQHGEISLSRNWSDFFIFGFAYIPLLHIGMNAESREGQQSWPLSKSGASHKKVLGILWSFLSDNQKLISSKGVFS